MLKCLDCSNTGCYICRQLKRKTMIEQKPTTKEKIALRLIMFAVRILLGYSMNDDLKSIYTKINTDLEN